MMALPFTITGKVIHGASLGNTYNSPTANIIPEEDVSALAHGVYFSRIRIGDRTYPAITNLGIRPTVSSDGEVNAETYIYGMSRNIYDMHVSIDLLEFSRPEKKFSSQSELFATVKEDIRAGADFHGIS